MSDNIYITGDTHGDFNRIKKFCNKMQTDKTDTMIILGDSGINYYTDLRRNRYLDAAANLPITLFCIHGNHEERAENIYGYEDDTFWGGAILVDPEYNSIKFAIDGEVYRIPTMRGIKTALVCGGAYSVDKFYRLQIGEKWYASEQPTPEIKARVEKKLSEMNGIIDIILTHTCPYRYIPTEWFLKGVDQSRVDKSTEIWLDSIFSNLNHFDKWYCGHYHGDKIIDKLEFMFKNINQL